MAKRARRKLHPKEAEYRRRRYARSRTKKRVVPILRWTESHENRHKSIYTLNGNGLTPDAKAAAEYQSDPDKARLRNTGWTVWTKGKTEEIYGWMRLEEATKLAANLGAKLITEASVLSQIRG